VKRTVGECEHKQGYFASRSHGCLIPVFSFASAAAISSQDDARQACHGAPTKIKSPSALHLATFRYAPMPPKVSSYCRVPTSQSLTVSLPPNEEEISRRPSAEKARPWTPFRWPWMSSVHSPLARSNSRT
jgi:hypothetical protein